MWRLFIGCTPAPIDAPVVPPAPVVEAAPVPRTAMPNASGLVEIRAAHGACVEKDESQTGMNICAAQMRDRWLAHIEKLEGRLSAEHPGLDLSTAWHTHWEAEHAYLVQVYARDGSMWPMVHGLTESRTLQDRAGELAYDLCEPRPVFAPGENCYSDAVGDHEAFVLCDEAAYDADLNKVYQALQGGASPELKGLLRDSQRAWIEHRDVETPVCSKMTGNPHRALRVRHRVEQLGRYLEAAQSGG